MWIVRLALRRPYTFTVMALLLLGLGVFSYQKMAKDIFPAFDLPVVCVVWTYGGLAPEEMEHRIVTITERSLTLTVGGIEHIESQSMQGVGIIKLFLHADASVEEAVAQTAATAQSVLRQSPPGTPPPLVIRFSAADVPILQIGLGSSVLSEQSLFDLAANFLRVQLATVQGASIPLPSGGKVREIMVDLNPAALRSYGITPAEVSAAVNVQSLTLPSGTEKIGTHEYPVLLNGGPADVKEFGNFPVKVVNGAMVTLSDVAQVRDAFAPQTSVVRQDGHRGALLTVMKSGKASTLDIIRRVRAALPRVQATLPPELELHPRMDQSVFVKSALDGVIRESLLAAGLTALMILLFLGSWRSTLVVAVSIPLSICCSMICLYVFGQTINAMTLGGFALAVGILVDDATVEVENISRNLAEGKPLVQAILDGAQQIAMPAFVSTLCICIVFVPIFFLTSTAKLLFAPLAMAVVCAMLASYFLSRTVVPTFLHHLLRRPKDRELQGVLHRLHAGFDRGFDRLRDRYVRHLDWGLSHPRLIAGGLVVLVAGSVLLVPVLGRDFFPRVDAGQIRLHVRAPAGTRVEETERIFSRVEDEIRRIIPRAELAGILDNIGMPNSTVNMALSDAATMGPGDGEILVSLNPEARGHTFGCIRSLRDRLGHDFPDCTFFTQPADIVSQILNFGLPAPIDLQISGRNLEQQYAAAQRIRNEVARIPGAVDVHVHQVVTVPSLKVKVDRTRAAQLGLTENQVANSLLFSLGGSGQAAANFWVNPTNGVQYVVSVQTPQYRNDSLGALLGTPVGEPIGRGGATQLLSDVGTVRRAVTPAVVNHYNIQPVYDVFANADGRDLGGVADAVRERMPAWQRQLPRGSFLSLRGQAQSMDASFRGLAWGVAFAVLLVYALMVVNFQSWLDPLIIIGALPGAACGVIWILFLTGTTLSVPSLMGAIMSVGVATANAILVVTFANEQRRKGASPKEAAIAAGHTRLRPVLMTVLAMIIGMLPMALGFGEGGEQNAPLARAVIGGLAAATLATLVFVPVLYAALRRRMGEQPEEEIAREMREAHLS